LQRVLTTVTLLGLLVATAAAFAITEHLKLIKSPVYAPQVSKYLSPSCRCATDRARISIKLRHRATVTVTIVDTHKSTVATLAYREPRAKGRHRWTWHGRTDDGHLAPDGTYRPEISLPHSTILLVADRIIVDTTAPRVLSASAEKGVLAGSGRGIAIQYALSEPAHAVVYFGGRRIIRSRGTREHAAVKWAGTLDGRPVRAGRYVLSVGALDPAGNETPVAGRKSVTVVVRYIDLRPSRLTVPAGRRFIVHVQTKSSHYTWRLGHRHGASHRKVLRLRAPTTRGLYRLIVAEHGHSVTAVVRVRAK
jgi:FlgD Ig-like domain